MRTTHKLILLALGLSVPLLVGSPVRAAGEVKTPDAAVVQMLPDDTYAFVLVNRLDTADEQIGKLAAQLQLPVQRVLPLVKGEFSIRQGVDDHGSGALAILPGQPDAPLPVVIKFIPVSDYKQFLSQFDSEASEAGIAEVKMGSRQVAIGQKGSFAVVANQSDREVLKRVLDNTSSLATSLTSLGGWINDHEISFVALTAGVKKGTSAAKMGLGMVKVVLANSDDPATKSAASQLEIYDWFLNAAEKELHQFAFGLHVDPDGGLHVDSRAMFVPGGAWASAGKSINHPGAPKLTGLPAGPFLFAFGGPMPVQLSQSMMYMSIDMINNMSKTAGGKQLTPTEAKQLGALMEKASAHVHSMSMVMGVPKTGESIYSGMAAVMKVENAKQYLADYQKVMEDMRDFIATAGIQFPFFQDIQKIKIGDDDAIQLSMDVSTMFAGMPNKASKEMLEKMVGPGGKMTAYLVPVDETTVAMAYIKPEGIARVKAALGNPSSSLGADPEVATTQKLLPPSARWVAFVSLKGFVDFASNMVPSMAPPGAAVPNIPPFPASPPIGIGIELSGQSFDVQTVVPAATLQALGTYLKQVHEQPKSIH